MNLGTVKVPSSLLLDQRLPESAKLLWMVLQVAQLSSRKLSARSGLARTTILKARTLLEASGWLPAPSAGSTAMSIMPRDLIFEPDLRCQAKLLFAMLQLTSDFQNPSGSFTFTNLSDLTGRCPNALKGSLRELQAAGWVRLKRTNKRGPTKFTLRNPVANHREIAVTEAAERLKEANFEPEAIMKELLDVIVDSRQYVNNARPAFLVNYFTGQRLEFDRFYPPRVAFEYQGQQHYRTTARYPKEAKVLNQRGRDMLKLGICVTEGITLVQVHAWDLTLEGMRRKVGDLLPLRNLENDGPLIAYLESVSPARRRAGHSANQHRRRGPAPGAALPR